MQSKDRPLCTFEKIGTYSCTEKTPTVKLPATVFKTKTITWSILGYSRDIKETRMQEKAIKRAFFRIGLIIPIRFRFLRNSPTANIVINFSQTDPYFKAHSSALAYGFVGTTSQPIDIVFNDLGFFFAINTDAGNNQYKLEPIVGHEIGHVLGLGHNPVCIECLMYPSYVDGDATWHDQDVVNLQKIWGKRTGFSLLRQYLYGYLNRLL